MRIGINARLLGSKPLEGIPRFITETTIRMIEQHPEDHFYFFSDKNVEDEFDAYDNVTKITIPLPTRLPILWTIWFDYLLPYYFKKYKIDAFYSGESYLSLRTEVPTLMVVHDLAYKHYPEYMKPSHVKFFNRRMKNYLEKAAKIVAVSKFTKDDILKWFPNQNLDIKVAYNALPHLPTNISSDALYKRPYFLYVGAIHPRKNIMNLVKAFELFKLANPTSKEILVLAGRKAWMNDELDAYVSTSKYREDIIFAGMVSEEVKHQLYQNSLALVYISQFEGFGIPVLEAFHHRIHVITSKNSSMEEIARGAAILVNPEDPHEISLALQKVSNRTSDILSKIDKSQEVLEIYRWENSAEVIYKGLKSISQ